MADQDPDVGGADGEEVEDDFEDGEFPFLKADHPLLERVQKALQQQLQGLNERVTLQLREKNEEYKKLRQHHEEVGVTLYGAQQQLAKLQLQLEQLHDKVAICQQSRLENDEELRKTTLKYEGKKQEVDESLKRLNKTQDELNQLNITLRQVEEYNTQMRAEIQVTRRAAYKAEDHIKGVEVQKQKQDVLIDSMNEELKRMTEQKALQEAQLQAQKQETEAAIATLRDAGREMEAVEFEKKQLMQQWRSSLVGMQRRDEALQNVQAALQDQLEQEMGIENEMRGLQKQINSEQERNEQLSTFKDRNDREMQHLQTQLTTIKADRERLMETYGTLKKSMDNAIQETTSLNQNIKETEHTREIVERKIQDVSREMTALVGKIDEESSEQTTVERTTANSKKRIKKIREEITQKEIDTQILHNENARVTVDSLNTKAHNQMLGERLKELNEDLAERERLIEAYEGEIRKRHNQIEKKQLYVDRLNREYDEKRSKLEGEDGDQDIAGPLEAKIKHLRKSIAEKSKECSDMQKDWIQKQTQLMSISTDTDRLKNHLNDQKNRKLVLDQKRIRIEGSLDREKREIRDLNNSVKHLRFDMDRMNGMLVKNEKKTSELDNSNQMAEAEFVRKLQEIESQCVSMEGTIDKVKEEKEQATADILEAERQVMLWERKITLEKEMQEALDPSVGQVETTAMQKEIHRMELRHDQLKRRQEQMIMEMERAIYKRDAISLKFEPAAKKNKQASTQANLKRQIQSLKSNLRLCTQANEEVQQKIGQREGELGQLQEKIEQGAEETGRLERLVEELRLQVQTMTVEKQRNLAELLRLQRSARRYEELTTAAGPQVGGGLRPAMQEQELLRNKLVDMVKVMQDAYPQIETLWNEFFRWLGVHVG